MAWEVTEGCVPEADPVTDASVPELTVTVALWDFESWLFVAVGAVVVVSPLPPPELDWPAVVDVGPAVGFVP